MTTYSFPITLNDSEAITLTEALKLLIKKCDRNLMFGARAPYWAHKQSAVSILEKLYENPILTSTNNFFDKNE